MNKGGGFAQKGLHSLSHLPWDESLRQAQFHDLHRHLHRVPQADLIGTNLAANFREARLNEAALRGCFRVSSTIENAAKFSALCYLYR